MPTHEAAGGCIYGMLSGDRAHVYQRWATGTYLHRPIITPAQAICGLHPALPIQNCSVDVSLDSVHCHDEKGPVKVADRFLPMGYAWKSNKHSLCSWPASRSSVSSTRPSVTSTVFHCMTVSRAQKHATCAVGSPGFLAISKSAIQPPTW